MAGLAICAGRGRLPRLLAEDARARGAPYCVVVVEGLSLDWAAGHPVVPAVFEKPGALFRALKDRGMDRVTFAGAITRPKLNPLRFDAMALRVAGRILPALGQGDDATLRALAALFEAEGLRLVAPQGLLADLVAQPGVITRAAPSEADRDDAARAARIAAALGTVDVGQGAVVAEGLCLGLESIQGTDAMLDFVARTRSGHGLGGRARGVLFKGPKPGQDWRLDLPAIGPDTVAGAARAGLAGIAVQAGGVMILGRDETIAAADEAGLFVWGREAGA